jgi:RNA-binding protein 5/10
MDNFTIASKPVIVGYIHAGVFVPAGKDEDARYSFAATTNPYLQLSYWDQKGYLKEHLVSEVAPNARAKGPSAASSAMDPATVEGLVKKDGDGKAKKRKAEAASSSANKKAIPSHLQFWKDRHNELHGGSSKDEESTSPGKTEAATPTKAKDLADDAPPSQSYADPNKKCCYLCSRQFKSDAEVNKHERMSQLHRDNLNNEELVTKAMKKLIKAGIVPTTSAAPSSPTAAQDTQEYRDRAKERRAVYGQPKRPTPSSSSSGPKSSKPTSDNDEPAAKATSKGASLLGKMGWTEGQGLGAQGSGNIAPIAQNVYADRVGIGAAGGKLGDAVEEAERRTKDDYGSFLDKTREGARGRFEAMKKDGD